ncbi:hypothetical protein MNBD_BACTEROID05-140 [hydrothermal vent metagenome]|uniref:Uncharacterized protein n=1 Tax=hydrothermal vent metagenome TaxID=652676 RepID=A0A3B0TZH1_9ZZZZ
MNPFFLRMVLCCTSFLVIGWNTVATAQPLTKTNPKKLKRFADLLKTITKNSVDEISYQISMKKKVYRYGERKVATSIIKNIGKRKIRVRLPTAKNGNVTYHVFQKTPEGREEAGRSGGDLSTRGDAGIVELSPGESCSTACEVDFVLNGSMITSVLGGSMGLDPEEYFLKANYHLVQSHEKGYRKKIVPAAKELSFTVRELTKKEQKELDAFAEADYQLFPLKVNGVRPPSNTKPLE